MKSNFIAISFFKTHCSPEVGFVLDENTGDTAAQISNQTQSDSATPSLALWTQSLFHLGIAL